MYYIFTVTGKNYSSKIQMIEGEEGFSCDVIDLAKVRTDFLSHSLRFFYFSIFSSPSPGRCLNYAAQGRKAREEDVGGGGLTWPRRCRMKRAGKRRRKGGLMNYARPRIKKGRRRHRRGEGGIYISQAGKRTTISDDGDGLMSGNSWTSNLNFLYGH